jgi:hypothetical protein
MVEGDNMRTMFTEMEKVRREVAFLAETKELPGPLPCRFETYIHACWHTIDLFFNGKQTCVSVRFQIDSKSKCTNIYVQTDSSTSVNEQQIQEMAKTAVLKFSSVKSLVIPKTIDLAIAAIKFPRRNYYWSLDL